MYGEEFPGAMLNGELPAFFFHFSVGPVLELFEKGGFDYGEADADAAFVADPHEAGFGQEEDVAFGQHELDRHSERKDRPCPHEDGNRIDRCGHGYVPTSMQSLVGPEVIPIRARRQIDSAAGC